MYVQYLHATCIARACIATTPHRAIYRLPNLPTPPPVCLLPRYCSRVRPCVCNPRAQQATEVSGVRCDADRQYCGPIAILQNLHTNCDTSHHVMQNIMTRTASNLLARYFYYFVAIAKLFPMARIFTFRLFPDLLKCFVRNSDFMKIGKI